MQFKCKLLSETAKPPVTAHDDDVGYDVFADLKEGKSITIFSGRWKMIPLGFAGSPDSGFYPHIMPKSGYASEKGIQILGGVVDPGYRNGLQAILLNSGDDPFIVKQGMKVAQIVFLPAIKPEIVLVDSLSETARGMGGFGSTGDGVLSVKDRYEAWRQAGFGMDEAKVRAVMPELYPVIQQPKPSMPDDWMTKAKAGDDGAAS